MIWGIPINKRHNHNSKYENALTDVVSPQQNWHYSICKNALTNVVSPYQNLGAPIKCGTRIIYGKHQKQVWDQESQSKAQESYKRAITIKKINTENQILFTIQCKNKPLSQTKISKGTVI